MHNGIDALVIGCAHPTVVVDVDEAGAEDSACPRLFEGIDHAVAGADEVPPACASSDLLNRRVVEDHPGVFLINRLLPRGCGDQAGGVDERALTVRASACIRWQHQPTGRQRSPALACGWVRARRSAV